jgi:hypothetical protein
MSSVDMPDRPLRACAGRCGRLVLRGRCPDCARPYERDRGSAAARGYDGRWIAFRLAWLVRLVESQPMILPVCGAVLPGGPVTTDSRCRQAGLLTYASADGSSLHLDHEPSLQPWERSITARVCDPFRVQLLCAECHGAKDDTFAPIESVQSGAW